MGDQNPYMQYPQAPHPHYAPYPQHPQQMHPPPPPQHPQHPQQHAYPAYGHQPPPPHQGQPYPMQYHPQVHNQPPPPHPMAPNHYMQYPQAPHPHYAPYPQHPQQMHPPPPPHHSPYGQQHPNCPPPQMGPHPPQPHPQQTAPMYSPHPQQPMHPGHGPPQVGPPPPNHQGPPPPHWVHGPHPQQGPAGPPHPQQHMMQHPQQQMPHPNHPPQGYYQPAQPPPPHQQGPPPPPHQQQPPPHHPGGPPPPPQQQQQQQPQHPQQQLPPPASPHHPPSRTHTPHHPPNSQTPTRVPPPSSTPASPSSIPKLEKKEITFPKNSVEATKPAATKKRKMTSKDVTDVEVWRLLMCLKSGLLAESSWAIDVLSILLNDDATLMYFGLQHMPGLLEAVLEHFKCCLNEIFDSMVKDTTLKPIISEKKPTDKTLAIRENGSKTTMMTTIKSELNCDTTATNDADVSGSNNINNNSINTKNNNSNKNINNNGSNKSSKGNKKTNGVSDEKNVITEKKMNGAPQTNSSKSIPTLDDQIKILRSSKNYTFKSRDGKIVKLKTEDNPVKEEPSYELLFNPVGYSHWQEGNGEDTSHIQVYFEPDNFIESSRRCTCLSTILRNLSFIPGNDVEMSKHAGLLLVLGRLLLLKHNDVVYNEVDSTPNEWHLLSSLREDTLVIISNISSSLDLSPYNDKINLSLLDGLLHWASCSSSFALDPFPAPSMTVSPQRLALESLAKLSIIEGNVDLILATPPWSRIEKLFEVLARLLNANEDQTIREFSLVLLSNLTAADSGIARKVALTGCAIPRLISFLETSLADMETFSTTQDMLRRAASTLKCLSQLVDNHPLFSQHQQRLLNLAMSQKLDQEVAPIIADVIFEISLSH